MESNADYIRGEPENIRSQEKLENSFPETLTELKALKSRKNNVEEWISDLEDGIMAITQQTADRKTNEKTWKQYKRSMG